jgi:YHS domain-containing protein/thioredoxin-related protein
LSEESGSAFSDAVANETNPRRHFQVSCTRVNRISAKRVWPTDTFAGKQPREKGLNMKMTMIRLNGGILAAALFCLVAASQAEAAQPLKWHTNLRDAARESQRSQKPMLIEISATWCGYCKKMKETFNDEKIARHVSGCFVPVLIDADENQQLVEAVGADSLPTTVIVSPDFRLLKKITGYYTPRQLDAKLDEICLAKHEVVRRQVVRKDKPIPVRTAKATTPKPAFNGHCLVSLFDNQKLKVCTLDHTTNYRGQLLCFASAKHKQQFDAEPRKYWPAMDGVCSVSLIDQKKPVTGKAIWGAIYHDQLWFFADKASRNKFADSPTTYIPRIK